MGVEEKEEVEEKYEIGLKSKLTELKSEDVEEDIKVQLKPKETPEKVEEETASLEIAVTEEQIDEVKTEVEVVDDIKTTLKKPTKKGKKPLVVEEPEESFEVKPRKPSVTQTENVETVADYELKQIKSETLLEDVEGEFQIGLKPKPKLVEAKPETVGEEVTVGMKPKRKTKKPVEDETASLKLTVAEEQIDEVKTEVEVVDDIKTTLKKPTKKGKKPLVVEEPEESFEVKPRKPSVTQTENVETVADYELKQIKSETLLEDVEGEFQ